MPTYVAVDLGASSGRVVNVQIDSDGIELDVVSRFNTTSTTSSGSTVWDYESLRGDIRRGLVEAAQRGPIRSVAIDSWAVDYGLARRRRGPRRTGAFVPIARTNGVMDEVCGRLGREHIYDITGIQFLPFNTIFQLVVSPRHRTSMRAASRLMMLPDLLNHDLCGSTTNDVTNASTTQASRCRHASME